MRFILNLLIALPMLFTSKKIGNDRKTITKLIKFLSRDNIKSICIDLRHIKSEERLNDIRRYINRFGSGISIVKNIETKQTKSGRTIRYVRISLYKDLYTHEDILRVALEPLLNEHMNKRKKKVVDINDYRFDKKLAVV